MSKRVGPYTVTDGVFTILDLPKIGLARNEAGERVFVDYSGTDDQWYEGRLGRWDAEWVQRETNQRRATLKGMLTRRANKAKRGR